jgi:hypothetical protein
MTRTSPRLRLCAAALALVVAASGCGGGNNSTPIATPTFGQLEIPDPSGSNNWTTYSTSAPPPRVLPTRGRGVRLRFYAPQQSAFAVSLRDVNGATVANVPFNSGQPAPPEAGYFQIIEERPDGDDAIYHMYVRAPQSLADPANYDILVAVRTGGGDGSPMVVVLRQRPVFTVTVRVVGSGRVVSTPPGIQCGVFNTSVPQVCTYEFGPGTVRLDPNSHDNQVTRFKEWGGNCAAGVQSCELTLDGTAAVAALATFEPRSNPTPASTCPPAPRIAGLRWIDIPDCATGNIAAHPGISHPALCDAQGYFCCEPGGANNNAPRCGGAMKIESLADCGRNAPRGMLRQPGGCYEVDSFP